MKGEADFENCSYLHIIEEEFRIISQYNSHNDAEN